MAELIDIITIKKNWQQKINNNKIINKWTEELIKQNVDINLFQITIKLLQKSILIDKHTYYDDDSFNWHHKIDINSDLQVNCSCVCLVCDGSEILLNDYDDLEEHEINKIEEKKYIMCKCLTKLNKTKKNILSKYINHDNNLLNINDKNEFIKLVNEFQKNNDIDYHPNSNNQVIDIVHPSLYPFIKGISELENDKIVHDNIIFQWLPSEFKVIKNENNDVKNIEINSYINNLDKNLYPKLYDNIGNIFGLFVPKFENILSNINVNSNLSECQVIVKLCNTVLTPENPTFDGGSWHLEGLEYENIIATGIYYYKMENIKDNYLNFRATVETVDIYYPQYCPKYVENHYGITDDNNNNELNPIINLGKIKTEEDMFLVFPNFLQHKVSDFELIDKTSPGTRNILVFFLINPDKKIISTNDIEPQQNLIPLERAKLYRELLMFERKYEIKNQNNFYERKWSLCEH